MDIKQIKELMAAMEKGGLRRLRVKDEKGFEIELEKEAPPSAAALFIPPVRHESHPVHTIQHHPSPAEEPKKREAPGKTINAPLVGTFYVSPSPADPVFVKVGDMVDENTVVCIIEAMKVMNEVKAGIKGQIVEVLADNAQSVEFGTPLFRVV